MFQAYLIFRSVTAGQRAKAVLDRYNLPSQLRRSPRQLSQNGCAYALTVAEPYLDRALRLLRQERVETERIYLSRENGVYERVSE